MPILHWEQIGLPSRRRLRPVVSVRLRACGSSHQVEHKPGDSADDDNRPSSSSFPAGRPAHDEGPQDRDDSQPGEGRLDDCQFRASACPGGFDDKRPERHQLREDRDSDDGDAKPGRRRTESQARFIPPRLRAMPEFAEVPRHGLSFDRALRALEQLAYAGAELPLRLRLP